MRRSFIERGFLPERDPLREFPHGSPLAVLDEIGHDLPSLLHDEGFRDYARRLTIPPWTRAGRSDAAIAANAAVLRSAGISWLRAISTRSAHRRRRCCPRISPCRCAIFAGGCRGRRFSATTVTHFTTGSDSIPPARSRWAISTRCKTSFICTTSIGSFWFTSRSKPTRP